MFSDYLHWWDAHPWMVVIISGVVALVAVVKVVCDEVSKYRKSKKGPTE